MCTRLYMNTILAVAMITVTLAGVSIVNAQITEKQKSIAPVVFDPHALAQAIKELKTLSTVDLFETPLKDILNSFTERNDVTFKVATPEPAPVTIKTTGQFGHVLVRVLATVKCEYAILPNGVIVVRESPKTSTDKHGKTARP